MSVMPSILASDEEGKCYAFPLLNHYLNGLSEIASRIRRIETKIKAENNPGTYDIEEGYFHLRICLELLLTCLAAANSNVTVWDKTKSWKDAEKPAHKIAELEKQNPYFFPEPVVTPARNEANALSAKCVVSRRGKVSRYLHVNTLRDVLSGNRWMDESNIYELRSLIRSIINLLEHHTIWIKLGDDCLWKMNVNLDFNTLKAKVGLLPVESMTLNGTAES